MSEPIQIFKDGIVPSEDKMPPEHTHERAKLIYRLLKGIAFMQKNKRQIALAELKLLNKILWDRVMCYLGQITEEEIQFLKGPRPWFHDDGKLAIYDPIKDNPLLMAVYKGEKPEMARPRLILPG